MTSSTLQQLNLLLASTVLAALTPSLAAAQQAYGKVLDAAPIYEEVAIPQKTCSEFGKQQRCENTTLYEEQLVGYEVLYEYQGKQYMQRMAQHPGKRIPVSPATTQHSYGSKDRASAAVATPGSKSYGSAAPGSTVLESIEYHGEEVEPLLNLNMRIGQPAHGQQPQPPHPHQR